MNKLLIAQFLIILSLIGCKNDLPSSDEKATYNINIQSLEKKPFPGELLKEIKYLKLETTKDCQINTVDKIIFNNELIYILDIIEKSIFVYNNSGKYLKKYFHYGRGPGEYLNLRDFDISKDGEFIYMTDPFQKTLYKYTIDDEFVETVKLDFIPFNFVCIDKNLIAFYLKNRINPTIDDVFNNNIVLWDTKKKSPVNGYFPIKENRKIIGNSALYLSNEQVYYCPYSTNEVFKISGDEIYPFVNFLGSNQIEEEIWEISNSRDFLITLVNSNYYHDYRNFHVANGVISFAFTQQKNSFKIFYSIITNKIVYGSGFPHKSPKRIPGNMEIKGVYKDDFVSIVYPSSVMINSNNIFPIYKDHPDLHKELIELCEKTSISDNPFLVFFKIKID